MAKYENDADYFVLLYSQLAALIIMHAANKYTS